MKTRLTAMISFCLLSGFAHPAPPDVSNPSEPPVTEIPKQHQEQHQLQPEPPTPNVHSKQHPLIEVKVGYFFFTGSDMRHVYDKGGLDVQLSGSVPIYKVLHLYGSAEYLEKSGRSLHGHQKTFLRVYPFSLGLRTVFPMGNHVEYYLTLGPRYFFVHAHNHSSHVPKKMHASGCGGFANTGFLFIFRDHFTLDLFGEYSYKRLHFHSKKPETHGHIVQVGGLTFGGGLGCSF